MTLPSKFDSCACTHLLFITRHIFAPGVHTDVSFCTPHIRRGSSCVCQQILKNIWMISGETYVTVQLQSIETVTIYQPKFTLTPWQRTGSRLEIAQILASWAHYVISQCKRCPRINIAMQPMILGLRCTVNWNCWQDINGIVHKNSWVSCVISHPSLVFRFERA